MRFLQNTKSPCTLKYYKIYILHEYSTMQFLSVTEKGTQKRVFFKISVHKRHDRCFPLIRGMFVFRSGLRFSFRTLVGTSAEGGGGHNCPVFDNRGPPQEGGGCFWSWLTCRLSAPSDERLLGRHSQSGYKFTSIGEKGTFLNQGEIPAADS